MTLRILDTYYFLGYSFIIRTPVSYREIKHCSQHHCGIHDESALHYSA